MAETKPGPLFPEFPPISTETWMALVNKDLKGAEYEKKLVKKTEEGIAVQAILRSENLPSEEWLSSAPALRGCKTKDNDWAIREQISGPDPAKANELAKKAIARGAQQVAFKLLGGGVNVTTQDQMHTLLDGIDLKSVPVVLNAGALSAQALAMLLVEAQRQGVKPADLKGGVQLDPLMQGATKAWADQVKPVVAYAVENLPGTKTLAVDAAALLEAGASAAQELGFGVAALVEYVAGLSDAGIDPAKVVAQTEVRFGVGSNYFLEIAKLRAARTVIAQAVQAFGVKDALPAIHATTSALTQTVYDPYVNMLRATTEAMSAAVAGVDSMTVSPFDAAFATPDEFSQRIARNAQIILKSESHMSKVIDPAGGSYYVESLTKSLAEAAWKLFQMVEELGGFAAALQSGFMQGEVASVRASREKAVAQRRKPIVGASNYPNLKETQEPPKAPAQTLVAAVPAFPAGSDFVELLTKIRESGGLTKWISDAPATPAFPPVRVSEGYERLRLAVDAKVAAGGKRPVVFLAQLGNPTMRKARATFVTGFFGCGGYAIVEHVAKEPEAAAQEAKKAGADLVVLCSSDDEYATFTAPLKKALGPTPKLLVAGYPQDAIEQLKADGADDFVHIKLNVVETLERYHKELGVNL